ARDQARRGRLELRVEQDGKREPLVLEVRLEERAGRATVHGDAKDDQTTPPVRLPQRLERRHLERARRAPRRPEVQDEQVALELLERGVTLAGKRAEPEGGPPLASREFDDARLLEGIEGDGVIAVMAAVHPGTPGGRSTENSGEQGEGQHRAQ